MQQTSLEGWFDHDCVPFLPLGAMRKELDVPIDF